MSNNANDLTRIAEAADGLRGYGKHFVSVKPGDLRDISISRQAINRPNCVEMTVDTPAHPIDRLSLRQIATQVEKIVITHRNGTETTLYADPPQGDTSSSEWVDALFFSPSAFDKFVLPYLSSVYDAHIAKDEHDRFVQGWITGDISFLRHAPPTVFS